MKKKGVRGQKGDSLRRSKSQKTKARTRPDVASPSKVQHQKALIGGKGKEHTISEGTPHIKDERKAKRKTKSYSPLVRMLTGEVREANVKSAEARVIGKAGNRGDRNSGRNKIIALASSS